MDACAPIIAQAYHDGDYDGFWQALSNATSASDFLYYKNDAFQIIEQTIILTGLLDHDISGGALHDQSFAQAVTRDTIKMIKITRTACIACLVAFMPGETLTR